MGGFIFLSPLIYFSLVILMTQRHQKILSFSGLTLLIGSSQFLVLLIVASSLYPDYSISRNYISDLGATCRAQACIVFQPSSAIFTVSIILLGVLMIISSMLLRRGGGDPYFYTFISISGIGCIGVGVFSEVFGLLHTIFASIAFVFGAAAPIASYRMLRGPARIVAPVMGFLAALFLVLFMARTDLGLGPGGVERLVAYFELIPGIIIGSYLLGSQQGS